MTGILGALSAALLLTLLALVAQRRLPPPTLRTIRVVLGVVAAAGALWAVIARQIPVAFGLAGLALVLLRPLLAASRAAPTPGQISEVRTESLVMTLDRDSGQMEGEVLAGRFAGRRLSELEPEDLQALLDEVEGDEENLTLLLAYLERRGIHPEGTTAPSPDPTTMSEEDAYRILGLAPGLGLGLAPGASASADEVRAAYRRLMRKVHPDLGGSPALASLLNAAKQRLDPG